MGAITSRMRFVKMQFYSLFNSILNFLLLNNKYKEANILVKIVLRIYPTIWFENKIIISKTTYLNNEIPQLTNTLNKVNIKKSDTRLKSGIKFKNPSIFYPMLPKSASGSISRELCEILSLKHITTSSGLYPNYVNYLVPTWVNFFSKGGMTSGDHTVATQQNLDILNSAGIHNVVVNVRDLRQVMLSLVHHFEKYYLQKNGLWRYYKYPWLPVGYEEMDFSQKLTSVINKYLPLSIQWIQTWMNVEEEKTNSLSVLFTNYEDYVDNKYDFYSKILKTYGVSHNDRLKTISTSAVRSHFRLGVKDEWRNIYTDEQYSITRDLIPEQMKQHFDWKD